MYYPKSQIKPNLYTNGDKYALSTTKEAYVGYYYSTSSGTSYTGKYPNDGKNTLLIPILENSNSEQNDSVFPKGKIMVQKIPSEAVSSEDIIFSNNVKYSRLKTTTKSKDRFLPQPEQPNPSLDNYRIGSFLRYFVKKNNESIYFEVSTSTYNLLKGKSSSISYELYSCIEVEWTLVGPKSSVYASNKAKIKAIEKSERWPGFFNYFNYNFSQYNLD